jgi:hypothetical protein
VKQSSHRLSLAFPGVDGSSFLTWFSISALEKNVNGVAKSEWDEMSLPKPVLKVGHVWWSVDQRRVGKEKELVAGINEYWTRQRGLPLSILFYIGVRLGGGVSRRHCILRGALCKDLCLERLKTSRWGRHDREGLRSMAIFYKYKAETNTTRALKRLSYISLAQLLLP